MFDFRTGLFGSVQAAVPETSRAGVVDTAYFVAHNHADLGTVYPWFADAVAFCHDRNGILIGKQ